jgi:hypothetical protein
MLATVHAYPVTPNDVSHYLMMYIYSTHTQSGFKIGVNYKQKTKEVTEKILLSCGLLCGVR